MYATRLILPSQSLMSTSSCILMESHSVSTVIGCWLIPNHWLTTRRFVQNVQEQLISLKSRGNHTSVLTVTGDICAPLMWSAIASPNILMYSCTQIDAFGGRSDTFCTRIVTYCTHSDIVPAWVHVAPAQMYFVPRWIILAPGQICLHSSLPSFLYCIFLLPCPLLCQSETSVLVRHLSRAVRTCIHSSFVTQLHHHYCTISSPYVSFVNASVWPLPAA